MILTEYILDFTAIPCGAMAASYQGRDETENFTFSPIPVRSVNKMQWYMCTKGSVTLKQKKIRFWNSEISFFIDTAIFIKIKINYLSHFEHIPHNSLFVSISSPMYIHWLQNVVRSFTVSRWRKLSVLDTFTLTAILYTLYLKRLKYTLGALLVLISMQVIPFLSTKRTELKQCPRQGTAIAPQKFSII